MSDIANARFGQKAMISDVRVTSAFACIATKPPTSQHVADVPKGDIGRTPRTTHWQRLPSTAIYPKQWHLTRGEGPRIASLMTHQTHDSVQEISESGKSANCLRSQEVV
jgi:hypothetical protein